MAKKKTSETETKPTEKNVPLREEAQENHPYRKPFPVVALGGSAGGLEAFETFFENLPRTVGAAFVVISHLDPKHVSLMSELIGRFTQMSVREAQNDTVVEPGNVYVIPPNSEMSKFHGKLRVARPDKSLAVRMPLDAFLRSLAEDQADRAVAIIMSGTGTDGTLGVRAIDAAGGLVLIQDPADARYDGMPESAIRTGLFDYVLPAKDMAHLFITLMEKHRGLIEEGQGEPVPAEIQNVLSVVRARTGHDVSLYKKNTMNRRIRRRMNVHNIHRTDDYVRFLRNHPEEVNHLFRELLITVTNFFRDPEAFDTLKTLLPAILNEEPDGYTIRVWVPACATGEEAYSLAILIRELAEETGRDYRVQVFATDIDEASIAQARTGLFPANITLDVSEGRLARYFMAEQNGYRVRKDIRESIVFATQDIVKDAPFTRLNIVSCRNLLIYMEPELQNKIITVFHYSLKAGGILFLGSSESVGNRNYFFRTMDKKWKIFQAKPATGSQAIISAALPAWPPNQAQSEHPTRAQLRKTNLEDTVQNALLSSFAPPAVVVNEKGDILYIHGNTSNYLTPSPGRPAFNIGQMTREGLRFAMRSALLAATSHQRQAVYRNVKVKTNGVTEMVDLSLTPLARTEDEEPLYMFTFQPALEKERQRTKDGKQTEASKEKVLELEKELVYTRESLQAAAEEAQAANEELKSANEELQSSNEELQSTNEELETSKEELQSVNEELTTVNGELRSKIDQLSESESDMKNLLDSTEIATIFLDSSMRIKRFNTSVARIINLIPSDIGRPIDDVTLKVEYPDLAKKARHVIDTLRSFDAEVQAKDKSWYLMRIVPYRTLDSVIDGVVMTFTNCTESKQIMQEKQEFLENIVKTVREPFLVLDEDLRVLMANKSFLSFFRVPRSETEGRKIKDLGHHEWDITLLRNLLFDVIASDKVIEDFRLEADFPTIGRRVLIVNARKIRPSGSARKPLILLAIDIANRGAEPGTGDTVV